ncbi:glucose uptake inhibitor SgrT [Mixta tenebrionis]|uniref:Glucose uptake inhibitor SgrT n=1 Tax=Mixta tenebrionis TaxID=2562439 RepID=A0A506V5C3_9GAMM|nr:MULTISPECIES: glucose uptake inhibitor SgrT [Mixta]QHM77952.1 hypothetical protein C7M52_03978 [Mixta theicola]TPW40868.1 glucose uptake inhibitor SgrT [Mixta tenebrionis]
MKNESKKFYRSYFSATENATNWFSILFSATRREAMLDSVMQWDYTRPAIKK